MAAHIGLSVCFSAVTIIVMLCLQVVEGRSVTNADEQGEVITVSVLAGVVGLIGLAAVVMLCAGHQKVNPNINKTGPPEWTRSLYFKNEMNVGFGDYSEGIHAPTPQHVIRERLGRAVTDAARWSCPISEGKHVFEVYWPKHKNRGHTCCIGLGSEKVALKKQGRCSLVGEHSESWGLDVARQQSLHFNARQQRLYTGVPDRFFVYVDMDSGKIGFGDDVAVGKTQAEFYGYICHGIPKNKTMYLIVSMCAVNENVHVHYRGTAMPQGGYNLVDVPSPLQLSTDNLGNVHVMPPAQAPPTYMVVVGQQGPPPIAQPQGDPGMYPKLDQGQALQF